MEYSYSFSDELQQEWHWPERYGTQPEILRYINHVADRFDLRRDIEFNTRVKQAVFDREANTWTVKTDKGSAATAGFCIMATGNLSTPRSPGLHGLQSFKGEWYHTGLWPHEGVDFTGLRVGVIGTGSSGVQSIPIIAKQAKHLYVFQRTANFSLPARNAPTDPDKESAHKAQYPERRRAALIGTKRFILDTDYYETYNRDNVTLSGIRTKPIKEITPSGLRTANADYALDAIVFATGFDAMTGQ
jgi:cyclohexanone monooxygenase